MKRIESSWSRDVRAGSVVDSRRAGSMGISLGGIILLFAWVCKRVSRGRESKRRNPLKSVMSLAKLHIRWGRSQCVCTYVVPTCVRVHVSEYICWGVCATAYKVRDACVGQMQMDADLHDVSDRASDSRPTNVRVSSNFLLLHDVMSLLPIPSTLLHAHPYAAAKIEEAKQRLLLRTSHVSLPFL